MILFSYSVIFKSMSWLTLIFGNFISVPRCHRTSVWFSVEQIHSGGTIGSKKYLFWRYDIHILITFLISLTKCLTKPASWGKGVVECIVHHDRNGVAVRTWVSSWDIRQPQQPGEPWVLLFDLLSFFIQSRAPAQGMMLLKPQLT